ncbi:MAG: hydroxymethylglutaryl-CoA lyase [Lentisphaeria bacterium]|jgi:hydroxymethylglutaryl-CoA lyase
MNAVSCVKIVEVGPRDGLQNESNIVDIKIKLALIEKLEKAGVSTIEAGSFVSAKWVPQMAASDLIYSQLNWREGVSYPALIPNIQGLERALSVGVKEVNCFTAASEAFNQKNINCSIEESLQRIKVLVDKSLLAGVPVRGYVSCIAGCPYQGEVDFDSVKRVSEALFELGCYEVALGDTIGVATPGKIVDLLNYLSASLPLNKIGLHLHDTYGQALANIYAGLQCGITTFDSSVAGLGGCPYAKGASGNVATEDLVYMFRGMDIDTGIDLPALVEAGNFISNALGRANASKVAVALNGKQ